MDVDHRPRVGDDSGVTFGSASRRPPGLRALIGVASSNAAKLAWFMSESTTGASGWLQLRLADPDIGLVAADAGGP